MTHSCVGACALLSPPRPAGLNVCQPLAKPQPQRARGAAALPLPASARPGCQRAVSQPRCSLGLVLARGDELERFIGVTHTLPCCSPHVLTLLAELQGGGSALRCQEQLRSPSQNWWGLAAQVGLQTPHRARLKGRAVPVPPGSLSPAEPPVHAAVCCPAPPRPLLSYPKLFPLMLLLQGEGTTSLFL